MKKLRTLGQAIVAATLTMSLAASASTGEVNIGLILETTPNQPFVQLPKTQAAVIFDDLQRHTTLKAREVALVKGALVYSLIGELPDPPFFSDTGPTDAKDSVFLTI